MATIFKKTSAFVEAQVAAITRPSADTLLMRELETIDEEILQEANAILEKQTDAESDERLKTLALLGFSRVKAVDEAISREYHRHQAKTRKGLVEKYRIAYPFNKFITQAQVERICETYDLHNAPVVCYKATIPEKNQREIVNFRWRFEHRDPNVFTVPIDTGLVAADGSAVLRTPTQITNIWWDGTARTLLRYEDYAPVAKENGGKLQGVAMRILAPKKELDLTGMGVTSRKVDPTMQSGDPIVLQPIEGGFLIVTAWGPEASDPEVVNERLN